MSRWKSLPWIEMADLPQCAGVYVIYREAKVIYVGQSRNLFVRLRQHAGYFDKSVADKGRLRLKYKPCLRAGEWLALEYRLILRLRPELNAPIHPAGVVLTLAGRKRVHEPLWVIRGRATRRRQRIQMERNRAKLARKKQQEQKAWDATVAWNRSR